MNGGTNTIGYAYSRTYVGPGSAQTVGGLVGNNTGAGTVNNSFWNTETTGQSTSAGGTGLTTAQMMLLATFTAPPTVPAWDMDDAGDTARVWRIYDGHSYPLLRSFLAPLVVTANDDTRSYSGIAYSGGNGVAYSPVGYDASKVFGAIVYSGTSQGAIAPGAYTLTPGGLWSNQPGYDILYVSGALTILPPVGRVPDGVLGTPLTVSRNLSQINLAWGASCGPAATNFAVYEGTIGTWYSHAPLLCSTGGAPSATVTPAAGNRYYLVVPMSVSQEGSYGTRSGGAEIPASSAPCLASQDLSPCP